MGAKLTRMDLMIVNFMCQFNCPWSEQMKQYFWVCLRGCFQIRLAFELMGLVDYVSSVGGHHPVH